MYEFHLPDMTCGHCEKTLKAALSEALPGKAVTIDLAARTAVVEGDAALADVAEMPPRAAASEAARARRATVFMTKTP